MSCIFLYSSLNMFLCFNLEAFFCLFILGVQIFEMDSVTHLHLFNLHFIFLKRGDFSVPEQVPKNHHVQLHQLKWAVFWSELKILVQTKLLENHLNPLSLCYYEVL